MRGVDRKSLTELLGIFAEMAGCDQIGVVSRGTDTFALLPRENVRGVRQQMQLRPTGLVLESHLERFGSEIGVCGDAVGQPTKSRLCCSVVFGEVLNIEVVRFAIDFNPYAPTETALHMREGNRQNTTNKEPAPVEGAQVCVVAGALVLLDVAEPIHLIGELVPEVRG